MRFIQALPRIQIFGLYSGFMSTEVVNRGSSEPVEGMSPVTFCYTLSSNDIYFSLVRGSWPL